MNSNDFKKIIVIIVTFNAMRWIEKCLSSLENSTISLFPVIIDNNSCDGTVDFVKQNYPEIGIIENSFNLGFGKANNMGIQYAIENAADFILLLNQDVWIEQDTVAKLLEMHRADPHFGIISPVQLNGTGNDLDRNFSTYIPFRSKGEINQLVESVKSFVETNFVNAAVWLLPIDLIFKVGGFDPIFFHYGEDRDLCDRAYFHGYKIGIALNTAICHDRVYSATNQFRRSEYLLYAVGLAHLKNLNHSLLNNFLSWIYQRFLKLLKWILLCDVSSVYHEILVNAKLLSNMHKISKSRKHCKSIGMNFLN